MARRFINQFAERDSIDQTFLAVDKQLRANRNGNLYLQLRLADRTGALVGMFWNATDQHYASFDKGDYLRVVGTTQVHHGALQMIVTRFEKADTRNIDPNEFMILKPQDIERYTARVTALLRGMRNYPLRNLADCFLMDDAFMTKFTAAPAGIKNHHAYQGGLLEHTLSLMELCQVVAPRYPEIDPDLLLLGAFLHDIGKIDELVYDREMGYSDEGQLIGHLVMGVGIVERKTREAEKLSGEEIPRELLFRLQHMVVSHHGDYDMGSPKLPMTLEAVALHYLDSLDAKIHSFSELIKSDVTVGETGWTNYFPNIGRKLFKGVGGRKENGG